MTGNVYKLRSRFKGFLFIFALALILALLFYTQSVVNALRSDAKEILEFYANLIASAASAETDTNINFIFDEIILRIDFPIVMTDPEKIPTAWKGIGIDPDDRSAQAIEEVRKIVAVMEKEALPIPLKYEAYQFGYLFYGDSQLIKELQLLPYVGVSVVSLFILVGFLGLRSIQHGEQQFIWVGMSKETAHQIGTPLSSLMGWLELLKMRIKDRKAAETLAEMEKDLERLNKIAGRFSQIGSKADLKEYQLDAVIGEVVTYFERRLPQWGKKVVMTERYDSNCSVAINRDLFEWVIENLLKNSIDALKNGEGNIAVHLGEMPNGKHTVYIDVVDNGHGIDSAHKKDVFKPGYSTKKRGWGLGLSLAKRIIEDYHGGKLLVKESKPGHGTTMRILLRSGKS
jgi:signal transduction histidine kinase